MKKKLIIVSAILYSLIGYSQTTIYSENFDGQVGKGATGATPTIDISGVDWNVDVSGASGNANYRFIVRNVGTNPLFEARRLGTSIWLSPSIDISTYTDVAFTIDASQGGNNLDNDDTLVTQYRIDSGTWTNASINGSLSDDYGSLEISQTGLNGSTLELRVIATNNANNERQRIDNIEVTGIDPNNPSYCTSVGTRDTFDTNTTLVSFGDINNNTVIDDGAPYHDYTALSNSIAIGEAEDLTINIDTDGDYTVYCYVWIDWNRDGDFEDAGETYDLGFSENTDNGPTSNSPLSIVAPSSAVVGDTRMRVVSEYYFQTIPTNGPCDGAEDGEVEDYTVTILPAIDYVYDNGWTPSDPNGVATNLNNITVEAGIANFNTSTNCNTLTVNPEGNVTIDSGVTLTIDDEMVLESTSTRYASLILDGTINGSVVYKRHVNNAAGTGTTTTQNDLISAPLTGQNFGDFRTANPNILSGTIGGNPAFLFGPFDPATEAYINYSPSDDTSTLDAGNGYRTGSTDGTTYTFTGTVETGNVSTAVVSGGASNWNLIGNPYPSYLKVQDFLNNTANAALIDETSVGIYGYDGTAQNGWVIYNLANTTSSTVITPGQGFFIDAEASGNMQFTPSMRDTGTTDDFIAGRNSSPLVYLKLEVSNTNDNFSTDFYFNDNSSLGLDPGYDAVIWNETPPSFSLYSHIVENNTGKAIAIQSLHSNDLFNVTIPLGVNTTDGSEIEFSIAESTIPTTINVYLEDTVENTMTLLTETNYTLVPNSALNGTGRFNLRFVESQLNIYEIELESLNIYTNNKNIIVEGYIQEQTVFQLYDIHGRAVKNTNLQLNLSSQMIDVSNLTTGVYIVQLNNSNGTITQKVIIK